MPTETLPFDVVNFLRNDEEIAGYLREMLEEDDLGITVAAVEDVERAKELSNDESMDPAARLYRAARAVGLRLAAVPRAA